MKPQNLLPGHIAAFFTISVWAITFISTKVLMVHFTPVEILFYRLTLAVFALSIVSPPRLAWPRLDRDLLRNEWKIMAAGLCGVTLYFLFQNIALSYTLAANASVLISAAPLFTALLSRSFLKEKLKTNFFLGFAVAMAGIILVTFNGSSVLKLNPLGDLLSILAAVVWGFYCVLIKKINSPAGGTLVMTRKVVSYGLLFLLPVLPLFDFRLGLERLTVVPDLFNLIFLGVAASALCFVTWNFAVQLLGPVRTSAYIYIVPVIAIITSVLILHETVTLIAVVGSVLILAGMALSEWEKTN
jgi:drug/metabolite transporter (DMT)-like permease